MKIFMAGVLAFGIFIGFWLGMFVEKLHIKNNPPSISLNNRITLFEAIVGETNGVKSGDVVYISGFSSNRPEIKKSSSENRIHGVGLVEESKGFNEIVRVVMLDTEIFPQEDKLFDLGRQEPFVYDNGLEKWNTTNSAFGRWAYKAFRIRGTSDGKYLAELDNSLEIGGDQTNASEWIVASKEPRDSLEQVRGDLFYFLVVKKAICDGFENFKWETNKLEVVL